LGFCVSCRVLLGFFLSCCLAHSEKTRSSALASCNYRSFQRCLCLFRDFMHEGDVGLFVVCLASAQPSIWLVCQEFLSTIINQGSLFSLMSLGSLFLLLRIIHAIFKLVGFSFFFIPSGLCIISSFWSIWASHSSLFPLGCVSFHLSGQFWWGGGKCFYFWSLLPLRALFA